MAETLKQAAKQFVKTGHFPQYLNSLDMREAQAFWSYVKQLEG